MKLRINQTGFEGYTGQMGVVNFVDGLSVADVDPKDAIRMSAVMLCVWEDGTSVSIAQSLLDNANTPAPIFLTGEEGQHDIERAELVASGDADDNSNLYTEDDLSAIADKDGIKGLRAIADPLGVKGNSIKDLITALIEAKAAKE